MNKYKLWVVDDEESIRTICRSALEDDFIIETFPNGSEALLALNSKNLISSLLILKCLAYQA
tara:strand:+ start:216 stop:401 length:186 start_codon:yes stop_codon:yes gene_type:complete